MSNLLTMYDSVSPEHIPTNAQIVAGYVNGHWPTWQRLPGMFPHARIISIAVNTSVPAEVLDVESGDATPDQAPAWVTWVRQFVHIEPTIYCNASTWPAVIAAFNKAGVRQPEYWIARYDNQANIPIGWSEQGCKAKQYQSTDNYDISVVDPSWTLLQQGDDSLSYWGKDGASQVEQIVDARTAQTREWLFAYQGPNEPSVQKLQNAVAYWSQHGGDLTLAGIKDGSL